MKIDPDKEYQTRNGVYIGRVVWNGRVYAPKEPAYVSCYIPLWGKDGTCDFFYTDDENKMHPEFDLVEVPQ